MREVMQTLSVPKVGRFEAYPTYKASGVEWLGAIPTQWDLPPLYARYSIELGKMLDESKITGDYLVSYLRNVDVQWDRINFDDLPEMDIAPHNDRRYTVKVGDLLVCEGGEVGRCAIVPRTDQVYGYQKALHRLRPLTKSDVPRFMYYTLLCVSSRGVFIAEGNPNTIPHLTGENLRRYRFPKPPVQEQRAIAHFLDYETTKLDMLVEKKRALIEKLREKRTALISRTVTRGLPPYAACAAGLNPDPPLRPSGVAWIGDVPKHWTVLPYKRLCKRVDVGIAEAATHAYSDDGVPIIRSTNVRPNGLDTRDVLRIEPWFAEKNKSKTLHAGDLVTVRTGYPGTTAVIPAEYDGSQCFTLVMSTPKPGECSRFFSYLFNSAPGSTYFEMEGWGTAQTNISVPIVQCIPVARPPENEQRLIVAFLDTETTRIDAMLNKVHDAVDRLQEYRATLITAAVTGKIDVRGGGRA